MPNFGRLLPWAGEIDQELVGRVVNLSLSKQSSRQRPTSTSPCMQHHWSRQRTSPSQRRAVVQSLHPLGDAILYVGGLSSWIAQPQPTINWSSVSLTPLAPKDIDPLAREHPRIPRPLLLWLWWCLHSSLGVGVPLSADDFIFLLFFFFFFFTRKLDLCCHVQA